MKKILYVDSKGLEQMKLNVDFIATEEAFMTYRHPILVDDDEIELTESVTKSVVVYKVSRDADVVAIKEEKIIKVKDLANLMNNRTWVKLILEGDTMSFAEGSVGYLSSTSEGDMIVLNMKFDKSHLNLKVCPLGA